MTIPDLGPVETQPQHVVIYDRTARRWTVRLSNDGQWIGLIRGWTPGYPSRQGDRRLVTAFDPNSSRNLSDALQWAARIAEPRSFDLGPGNST